MRGLLLLESELRILEQLEGRHYPYIIFCLDLIERRKKRLLLKTFYDVNLWHESIDNLVVSDKTINWLYNKADKAILCLKNQTQNFVNADSRSLKEGEPVKLVYSKKKKKR